MESRSVAPALGRRFLLVALLVAVVPLGALGFWAIHGAGRSGRTLLRSQLEVQLQQVQKDVDQRWLLYRADLLMLGENEPVRLALLDPESGPHPVPEFVKNAFSEMTAFNSVTIRDRSGSPRWRLVDPTPARSALDARGNSGPPGIDVVVPITDLLSGDTIGTVEASLRAALLLPSALELASPSGPLTALVTRNGSSVLPPGADERLFTDESAEWAGHRWLAVREPSPVPGVDVVMAGPLDPFVVPFQRAARRGTAALLIAAAVVVVAIVALTRRMTREVERELAHREALAAVGEFASELSHEVRNPLTAIRLDLQRVQESGTEPETVRAIVSRVLRQIDRLDRAVTGALRVARGGSIEPKRIDLREVLEAAIRAAEPEFRQRGVRSLLSVDARSDLHIEGDAGALEQLFLNLLLNAAQALTPGGEARVTATRRDEGVVVTITDNGRGMSPAELSHVQRPYRSSRAGGTGLGLKIARRVAASHRGELEMQSTPGAGTTVKVLLP